MILPQVLTYTAAAVVLFSAAHVYAGERNIPLGAGQLVVAGTCVVVSQFAARIAHDIAFPDPVIVQKITRPRRGRQARMPSTTSRAVVGTCMSLVAAGSAWLAYLSGRAGMRNFGFIDQDSEQDC